MDYIHLSEEEYERSPIVIIQGSMASGKTVAVVKYLSDHGIGWDMLCISPNVAVNYKVYIKRLFESGIINTPGYFAAAMINPRTGELRQRYNRVLVMDCGSGEGAKLIQLARRYMFGENGWASYYHKLVIIGTHHQIARLIGGYDNE